MTDALLDLETIVPQLPAAVDRRRVGDHLVSTLVALKDAPLEFRRLTAVAKVAREIGFTNDDRHREQIEELLDKADDLATALVAAQDADGVRAAREGYEKLGQSLTAFERQVRQHWRVVAQEEFGSLAAIGQLFATIEDTAALGQRLVSCADRARRSADEPGAQALAEAILQLRRDRRTLEAEQADIIKDAEVATFLEALVAQRATLRMVTPSVHAWLDAHDALDIFRVRGSS